MTDIDKINRSINLCQTCGFDFRIFGTSADSQLAAEIARLRAGLDAANWDLAEAERRQTAEYAKFEFESLKAQLAAAQQDAERMRGALQDCAEALASMRDRFGMCGEKVGLPHSPDIPRES